MIIQANTRAMNVRDKMKAATTRVSKSQEKLTTGYRINSAADDASGLSVSEKFRSQIKSLSQAINNTQDGINYIQTGEGALEELHEMLQRGKQLCTEAANGPLSDLDRDALQLELDQLCSESDRIAETDFNGHLIFEDNTVEQTTPAAEPATSSIVMFSHPDGDYIPVVITMDSLADNIASVVNTTGKGFTTEALEQFAHSIKNTYLPQVLSRIVATLPNSSKPTVSGLEIGFRLYNENNNTLASVSSNGTSFQLNINVHHLNMDNGGINMTDDLAATMTHEMVHAVMFDTVSNGMLGINPNSNRQESGHDFPDWFTEGMAEAIAGGSNRLRDILPFYNKTTFTNEQISGSNLARNLSWNEEKGCWEHSTDDIKAWMAGISNTSDQLMPYEQGYAAVMYLGHIVGNNGNAAASVNGDAIARGLDKVLSEIAGGKSLNRVIKENTPTEGTNDFVNQFGAAGDDVMNFINGLINASNAKYNFVNASANSFTTALDESSGAGALGTPQKLSGKQGTLLSGGSNSYFVLDLENERVDNANKMGNWQHKYEGGSAISDGKDRDGNSPSEATDPVDPPGGGEEEGDENDPVDPPGGEGEGGGNTNPAKPGGSQGGSNGKYKDFGVNALGNRSAVKLDRYETLTLQVGARTNGLVKFTLEYDTNAIGELKCDFDCSADGLGINNLSLSTQEDANASIDRLDMAINKISMMRATFGAVQNRLEHKLDTLANTKENFTESESHIRDTDMATEMMNFTKDSILMNALPSMLAQANSAPESILEILDIQ